MPLIPIDRSIGIAFCCRKPIHEAVMSFLAELWAFMRARKKFWLVPVLIMMVIFGGLVVMTKGSVVAPFIYTIF
jgi:hypothetical protein